MTEKQLLDLGFEKREENGAKDTRLLLGVINKGERL